MVIHNRDQGQPHINLLELQCFFRASKTSLITEAKRRDLSKTFPSLGPASSIQNRFKMLHFLPVLSWAIKLDKLQITHDLILCKFDMDESDSHGETPFCLAIRL